MTKGRAAFVLEHALKLYGADAGADIIRPGQLSVASANFSGIFACFFENCPNYCGSDFMTEREYGKLVQSMAPKSPMIKDCVNAFWIGGLICALGQLILNGYTALGLDETNAGTATSMTLVALSALLTGLSLYDNIAKYAGAGTLVPITGFANSIAAPAVEFKTEGFVLGVGAKMFTIAGPVIVYGVSASVVYGLIYWITTLF